MKSAIFGSICQALTPGSTPHSRYRCHNSLTANLLSILVGYVLYLVALGAERVIATV